MTSKRIKTIASLVPNNAKILDIGTDHCFVPIFLYKAGISHDITGLDINPNPLASARENLCNANLDKKIKLLLNDGLNNLDPNIYDVIIIAGLGGATIAKIIDKKQFKGKLILHPTNNQLHVRKILVKNNFTIANEMIIKEKDIENLIIEAIFNPSKEILTKTELQIGPKLIVNASQEVTDYYEKKAKFYQDLYVKSNKNEYKKKAQEYQNALMWRQINIKIK